MTIPNKSVHAEAEILELKCFGDSQPGGGIATYLNPNGQKVSSWARIIGEQDNGVLLEPFKIDWNNTLNAQTRRGCTSNKQMCGHRPLPSCYCDYAGEVK